MARGPAPLLGELSAQLTERLLFNERPAVRQPRLSVLAPLPRPLVGTWRASWGNHTYPEAGRPLGRPLRNRIQAMEMSAGHSPQMAGRKKHTAGGLVRRGRPKGGRLAADGKKKTRPGERAGLFLSIYRMRQCSIVE